MDDLDAGREPDSPDVADRRVAVCQFPEGGAQRLAGVADSVEHAFVVDDVEHRSGRQAIVGVSSTSKSRPHWASTPRDSSCRAKAAGALWIVGWTQRRPTVS